MKFPSLSGWASSSMQGMWQRLGMLLQMPASQRNNNSWEKRMRFVHFQRQPQLQGMSVFCLPTLALGRLQRYQWNGWSTLFGCQGHQLQGQRNNVCCFKWPLAYPGAHGAAFLCWKKWQAPGELERRQHSLVHCQDNSYFFGIHNNSISMKGRPFRCLKGHSWVAFLGSCLISSVIKMELVL